jgi:hypothetical protein
LLSTSTGLPSLSSTDIESSPMTLILIY